MRIVSVADSYEAMTSDRLYRRALTRSEALAILRTETQNGRWDPQVISTLSDSLDELDNL